MRRVALRSVAGIAVVSGVVVSVVCTRMFVALVKLVVHVVPTVVVTAAKMYEGKAFWVVALLFSFPVLVGLQLALNRQKAYASAVHELYIFSSTAIE